MCDIADDSDLDAVITVAHQIPGVQLVGTSALAAALARTLPPAAPTGPDETRYATTILTVVGTGALNATGQVAALVEHGAAHISVAAESLLAGTADTATLAAALATHPAVALTVSGSAPVTQRFSLSAALGRFVADADAQVSKRPDLVLTGGETARSVIDALGLSALQPVDVVHHGAVVSLASDGRRIVTRPGSFGDRSSFVDIATHLSSPTHHPTFPPTHHISTHAPPAFHPPTTRRAPP